MKNILILIFALISVLTYAQDTTKVEYKKIAQVELSDISIFFDALNNWRSLEMYNPKTTDKEKVETFRAIDGYLEKLRKGVVIDSVIVEKKKPLQASKKEGAVKQKK
jgi:hypothetical protein